MRAVAITWLDALLAAWNAHLGSWVWFGIFCALAAYNGGLRLYAELRR